MSIEAMVAVRKLPKTGVNLNPTQRFILYALADYADDTGKCWPSYKTIEEWTGFGRSTVIRAVYGLKELGLLHVESKQRENGSDTSNVYRLLFIGGCQSDTGRVPERHPQGVTATPPELPIELPIQPTKNQKQKNVNSKTAVVQKPDDGDLSATPTPSNLQVFVEIWNENRGDLPAITTLSEKRRRALRTLVKSHNGQSEELFRAAVLNVAHDAFWIENGYGFDNLLRDGRVLEKAEKWNRHGGMTEGNRRMAATAQRIARAIGYTHAE